MRLATILPFLAVLVVLTSGSPTRADELTYKVTVQAGETARLDTPVFYEAKILQKIRKLVGPEKGPIPALVSNTSIGHDDPSGTQVAQVEIVDDKNVRVWWIVGELAAGRECSYLIHISPVLAGEAGKYGAFAWKDSSKAPLRSSDLLLDGQPVLRYMHTAFDKGNIELTKKPFHHAFDPSGTGLITKGAGGLYPHHRGIYFGYNRCKVGGQTYDTWHAKNGEHELHVKVLKTTTGPIVGGHTVRIDWNDRAGKAFATETRRLIAFRQLAGRRLIEFTSELRATAGPVQLGGDRQHAGVQFRAAQHVAENQKDTRYLRPAKWADLPPDKQINSAEHRDLPWNAVQFPMNDRKFTVAYLSDPANPDGADFSERLYGRFGEFFPWDLSAEKPLKVRYRWWIDSTGKVTRGDIARCYQDLADPPRVSLEK